jgi:hypothetical protein
VFSAGFNRLKRREFLRLFCLQIRHELDPCAPELNSDAEAGGERGGDRVRDTDTRRSAAKVVEVEENILFVGEVLHRQGGVRESRAGQGGEEEEEGGGGGREREREVEEEQEGVFVLAPRGVVTKDAFNFRCVRVFLMCSYCVPNNCIGTERRSDKGAFNFSEALLLVLQTGPSCDTGVFLMCS